MSKKPAGKPAAATHPTHPKAAKPSSLQKELTHLQTEITDLKHSAGKKHAPAKPKAKHKKAKKHAPAKRGAALAETAACCAAEALAASARLAGWPVAVADVLELHARTAGGPDDMASIAATLDAAARFGLGGVRPLSFGPAGGAAPGVLVGVTVPGGPHTVTIDPSGAVWSWGELRSLADLQAGPAEEAWVVTWP